MSRERAERDRIKWDDEVKQLKGLDHDHIVRILDAPSSLSIPKDSLHFCMEYCSEGDLRSVSALPVLDRFIHQFV